MTSTAAEIAQRWPFAVARSQELRDLFGPQVQLMYARNAAGDELKRRGYEPTKPAARL